MSRVILHSDLNNFYASVETLYDPSLKGKPIAVSGNPEARHGIILAKSNEAKKCGVKTGNPIWMAQQACPNIILIPPNYDRYLKLSKYAREIYNDYSDHVEAFGIDECWIDISDNDTNIQQGKKIADVIRQRIRTELGVTVSVGVANNKVLAKLGSDMKKPDAITAINKVQDIWHLPVEELLFVGNATKRKLNMAGIHKIGDLALCNINYLHNFLGVNGDILWMFANGYDTQDVSRPDDESIIKSIGNSTTTPYDLKTVQEVRNTFAMLADSVSARMREGGFICRTVQISIRDKDLNIYERQGKLNIPNRTAKSLLEKAMSLYNDNKPRAAIRSLGIRACDLLEEGNEQLSFDNEYIRLETQEKLETVTDHLKRRYGNTIIRSCNQIIDKRIGDVDPKKSHVINPVSYFKAR